MKQTGILFLLLFLFTATYAQQTSITGIVHDSATKAGLSYATVSLYPKDNNTPPKGVLTTDNGNFKLDNVKPGDYKAGISFVGYPSKFIPSVQVTAGIKERISASFF